MEEVYKEIRESGYSSTETIAQLFLNDPEHGQGVICSALRAPDDNGYQSFDVRFEGGAKYRVSFRIEELDT